MRSRVETGITGLDELLNGGFPAGGTYAIVGGCGTGKSILCMQFLYNGAIKFNEPGVYILLEEEKERMMSNMSGFGWEIERLEKENMLKIVPYTKSLLGDIDATFDKNMVDGDTDRINQLRQNLTMDSLFKEVEHNCQKTGAKRVVIDSLTVITLLTSTQLMARMHLLWFIEKLRKLNITTLVTIEEGVGYWSDALFLLDGIVYMMLKERGGIMERGIVVEKLRGTPHDTGVRPFKIASDGIRVYPREVIAR